MQNPFEIIADRLSNIEALLLDLKCRPEQTVTAALSEKIDFAGVMVEYYPGIPESTVRQDTARLARTKVGKRVLFDRSEVEEHLKRRRRPSQQDLNSIVEGQFLNSLQRRGGRTSQ